MRLPSSETLKRPLQISLILLFIIMVSNRIEVNSGPSGQMDASLKEEDEFEIYQQSRKFVTDLFVQDRDETHEQYVHTDIIEEDGLKEHWNNTLDDIQENELAAIPNYREQLDFYIRESESNDGTPHKRYGLNLTVELDVGRSTRETTVPLEWVEENGEFKLYRMKFPYRFIPIPMVGPVSYKN
ncbi:hypothetical protein [Texcoconibacillus texcoconensis]|uniref:Uncharacterized protein n=1 Tax=Texcoconibacillus texcoconensis TaxID=1095777 RepID=A0A840QP29_9BACI|nr:hypothetical protein [Texcoconibacillus texcoconensis]MBB5173142.1 hypothetical protein [Texcoconibacillus texcoconensis]